MAPEGKNVFIVDISAFSYYAIRSVQIMCRAKTTKSKPGPDCGTKFLTQVLLCPFMFRVLIKRIKIKIKPLSSCSYYVSFSKKFFINKEPAHSWRYKSTAVAVDGF